MVNEQELAKNSKKTAIGNKVATPGVRKFLEWINIEEGQTLLDYGSGKGRNTFAAKKAGLITFSYDKYPVSSFLASDILPECKFEYVICNYVLNVVPSYDRKEILENIKKSMNKDSFVLFEVRGVSQIQLKGKYQFYDDGVVTAKGTFQKGYKPGELQKYLENYGFEIVKVLTNSKSRTALICKLES